MIQEKNSNLSPTFVIELLPKQFKTKKLLVFKFEENRKMEQKNCETVCRAEKGGYVL